MHALSTSGESSVKRQWKVMTLEEKVKVIDKIEEGLKYTAFGKLFGVNESTVRYIEKNEANIQASIASSAPQSSKTASRLKEKGMLKGQNALSLWIQDQHRKGVAVNSLAILEKANSLYQHFSEDDPQPSTRQDATTPKKPFQANMGLFEKYKRRFSLKKCETDQEVSLCGPRGSGNVPG
ncbi:putative CENPB DNA-binding domain-containing protein 1 [Palaemon carinicauda]|uniref:putative CENPB DNA-binding domain-containing protein 1 n=1 Tax=Palaemon carinicauda TaxID=392227 RepID=UPI0035B5A117